MAKSRAAIPVFGFHFSKSNKLSHNDNRPLKQGKTYTVDKNHSQFIECGRALHGSPTPYDARWYVGNPKYLSLCIFHGAKAKVTHPKTKWGSKFAYERRTIIKIVEISPEIKHKLHRIFYANDEDSSKMKFNNLCYKLLGINPADYK